MYTNHQIYPLNNLTPLGNLINTLNLVYKDISQPIHANNTSRITLRQRSLLTLEEFAIVLFSNSFLEDYNDGNKIRSKTIYSLSKSFSRSVRLMSNSLDNRYRV